MKKPEDDVPRVKLRWSRYHNLMVAIPADDGLGDRLRAAFGALIGIAATGLLIRSLTGAGTHLPLLVAPMGAAAVLLFAVPASPMAQPWAVLGGNIISALVGVAAAKLVPDPMLAAGVAIAGAIVAMALLRCLHPPGGAIALTAVLGGPNVTAAGYGFALMPVAIDVVLLMAAAWGYHRFSGHSYPHIARKAPTMPGDFSREDLRRAIAEYPDMLDVAVDDLETLLHAAERHADARRAPMGRRRR